METAGSSSSTKNINRSKRNEVFKNWAPPPTTRTGRVLKTPDLLDANPTNLAFKSHINRAKRDRETTNNNVKKCRPRLNNEANKIVVHLCY